MHLKKLLALGLSLTMAVAPAERLRPARDRGRRYPVGAGYHLPNADEEAITAMTNALNAAAMWASMSSRPWHLGTGGSSWPKGPTWRRIWSP